MAFTEYQKEYIQSKTSDAEHSSKIQIFSNCLFNIIHVVFIISLYVMAWHPENTTILTNQLTILYLYAHVTLLTLIFFAVILALIVRKKYLTPEVEVSNLTYRSFSKLKFNFRLLFIYNLLNVAATTYGMHLNGYTKCAVYCAVLFVAGQFIAIYMKRNIQSILENKIPREKPDDTGHYTLCA